MPRAFEIALQTRYTSYDAVYLALALSLNATLVTADRKLIRAAGFMPGLAVSWEDLEV